MCSPTRAMASDASGAAPVAIPDDRSRSDPHRRRRYLIAIIGLVLIVGALAAAKAVQIGTVIAAGKRMQKAGPPPESVGVFVAGKQTWEETLNSVGSVTTARGVSISSDAAGIVSKIDFESGATVRQGQVLLELDTGVELAELASARAKRGLARTVAGRTRALERSGSVPPAQLDTDESQLAAANADVNTLQAQIAKKVVRAPFAGKLGIRLVNVGQFLAPGTPIAALESSESRYVDFSLPQQELDKVAVGMPVRFTLESGDAGVESPPVDGSVFAVDPAVDPTTRTIKLRAGVPAQNDELRPGMFVNVEVIEPQRATVIAVPATAIVHAPYGDSVFIIENDKGSEIARQQFVRLGRARGDFVEVAQGVSAGQRVVVAGAFKLRNRVRVTVTKGLQIHPELAPHPPNR